MKKSASPEERLLALIKGKGRKVDAGPADAADAPKPASRPEVKAKINKADAYITGMLKADIFKNRIFEPAALRIVNRYLIVIILMLAVYLMLDVIFVRPYKDLSLLVSESGVTDAVIPKKAREIPAFTKDYSQYSSGITGKRIFGSAAESPTQGVGVLSDATKDLGLVGIIPGSAPQAIIEDKKNQKTYYLNKGQSFDNFTVEEISDGKVILVDNEGKKIALFL